MRGHMEVWNILKDHIEMTEELKLEQLHKMITTTAYKYREEPHTEFKELLASMPVESVTLLNFSCFMRNWFTKQIKSTQSTW